MKILGVFLLIAACSPFYAQALPAPDTEQNIAEDKCGRPSIQMLRDGTAVITRPDCSVERLSKEKVLDTRITPTVSPTSSSPAKPVRAVKPQEPKPEELPLGEADPVLRAKYLAATGAYYDYFANGYLHRERVFRWQLVSSKIIFVLVILLVTSGVYFAAIQFHEGMRRRAIMLANVIRNGNIDATAELVSDDATTTLSASARGISVSSPILGVIILVVSLAFFYLYLVYIYPITEIF